MTDDRISSILGEWIEARDRGETVDPEEVIAAHPDLADELRRRFNALLLMEDALGDEAAAGRLRPLPEGRYGDFRVTGEGGMGIVYWALDTDLNRQVAFKIVRPDVGGGRRKAPSVPIGLAPPSADTPASQAFETLKARFLQEAWVTAGLEHPGIVPVYELGETPDRVPYYTMRFVRGSRTLASAIEEAKEQPVEKRLALLEPFIKVCDTIRYAHAHGVIHRDLKPDNVALGEFGEVVVLDWGLAKMKDQEDATAETWQERLKEYRNASDLQTMASALGTPGYMSPEAAVGKVDRLDERGDIYSLGAILFQILTGRLPFEFRTYVDLVVKLQDAPAPLASDLEPGVPEELSTVCGIALERQPKDRYSSIGEMTEAIRGWQRESAIAAEVSGLLREANGAYEMLGSLSGDALIAQTDRVKSLCTRILQLREGHLRARHLLRKSDAALKSVMRLRERDARRRLLKRAVGVVVLLAAVAALLFVLSSEESAEELDRVRAMGLVQASLAARDEDPVLSLLLAREAVRRSPDWVCCNRLEYLLGGLPVLLQLPIQEGSRARFSPRGDQILTDDALWDSEGGQLTAFSELALSEDSSSDPVGACAWFAQDGDRIIVIRADWTAHALDRGGKSIKRIDLPRPPPEWSSALDLSRVHPTPDGDQAFICANCPFIVINSELEVVASFVTENEDPRQCSMALSSSGDRVLGIRKGSPETWFHVWTLTGREVSRFSIRNVLSACFDPDGTSIAVSYRDGSLRFYRLDHLDSASWEKPGRPGYRPRVSFSPSGKRVICRSGAEVRVLNLDGKVRLRLETEGLPWCVAASSTDKEILVGESKGKVRLLADHGGISEAQAHREGVRAVEFSPDGKLAVSTTDREAIVWDLELS